MYITRCSCNLTVTRLVRLVEQELSTLLEHLNSSPVFSGVRVVPIVHCHVFTIKFRVVLFASLYLFYIGLMPMLFVFTYTGVKHDHVRVV